MDTLLNCKFCEKRQELIEFGVWCEECDVMFCSGCIESHDLDLEAQNHNLVPYSESHHVFSSLMFQNGCSDGTETQYLASQMSLPATVHSTSSTDVKMMENTQNSIAATLFNFKDVIRDRENNLARLKKQKKEIQEQVEVVKETLQCKCVKIEGNLLSEISEIEENLATEMKEQLETLKTKVEILEHLHDYTSGIQSGDHTYTNEVVDQNLVKYVHKEQKFLDSLSFKGKLDNVAIALNVNKQQSNSQERKTSLVAIEISKITSTYPLPNPCVVSNIETISKPIPLQLKIKQVITTFQHGLITGCCTLSNGEVIFADFDGINNDQSLLFYEEDGTFRIKMPLSPLHVFDVTRLEKDLIAVSGGCGKNIGIIDLSNNTVIKVIKTDFDIGGLFYRKGNLIYCVKGEGLYACNVATSTTRTIYVDKSITDESYVAGNDDRICYTNGNKVKVFNGDLELVFEYSNDTILKDCRGVAMDENMNVYVVGCESNSLVVISADGLDSKELLNGKDGLNFPMALHYDIEKKLLIVSNIYEKAFVYSIE